MTVLIQKKVDGEWRTIIYVDEERSHRVCKRLMTHNLVTEYRIVKNSEAD